MTQIGDEGYSYLTWVMFSNIYPEPAMLECTTSFPVTVVFPGQGSQRTGMGRDFDQRFEARRRVYDEASDALALGVSIVSITDVRSAERALVAEVTA